MNLIKLLLLSLFIFSSVIHAQDVITKKNGTIEKGKIVEIGVDVIKYKKMSNLSGPTYSIPKNSVNYVTYSNGTKEYFNKGSDRITNIQLQLEGNLLVAQYDITGNKPLDNVRLSVNTTGGEKINATQILGDVGHVEAGKMKKIVWDIESDGYDLQGKELSVKVLGDEAAGSTTPVNTGSTQYNCYNVLHTDELVFYGIDLTQAKMIGVEEFPKGQEIKNKYFKAWNQLMVDEKGKYDVRDFYRAKKAPYDISIVNERNNTVDDMTLVSNVTNTVTEADVRRVVSQYNTFRSGIGLVFIVEHFKKFQRDNFASIWVTFFDIKTKDVIFARKLKGKPGGFGLRNHWAGAVLEVMIQSEKNLRKWKKECEESLRSDL